MIEYFVGLDLGQSIDYTAVAVAEVLPVEIGERTRQEQVYLGHGPGWGGLLNQPIYEVRERKVAVTERHYQLRHLQRFPLGTSYPAIVDDVTAMLDREPLRSGTVVLALDWTGVGRPVLDMFTRAKPRARLVPVSIHGGDSVVRDGPGWHVPKRDLISTTQVALQTGRLRIAGNLAEAETLTAELRDYRVKLSASGHDSYSAREGQHDDLVLSVALAVWSSEHGRPIRWAMLS